MPVPVNIKIQNVNGDVSVMISPRTAAVGNRNPLDIQWSLVAAGTDWAFSSDPAGIVISTATVGGYTPWPNAQPTLSGGSYVATAPALNVGDQPQRYKYTINLVNNGATPGTMALDPDIANDPPGSSGGGMGHRPDRK